MSLAELYEEMESDLQTDPLCRQATNIVTMRGTDDPRVVFIGEAPGAREDETGRPFVGQAGELLDEWIAALGLGEDEYAITNIVKCRPPENRAPTQEEQERFGPWLDRELAAMDPEIIVTLGRTATEHLTDRDGGFLADLCYTAEETDHGTLVPLPHPAYVLRQGGGLPELDRIPAEVDL